MEFKGRNRLWLRDFHTELLFDPLDRISRFPEPILQHVLSFLSTADAIRASILSRKWRRVWSRSLQKLSLVLDRLDDQVVQNMLDNNFHGVEDLALNECMGLKNFQLSSYKLKTVEVFLCRGLEKVELAAPNLVTFLYHGFQSMPCEIKLPASKFLKHLKLVGVNMNNNLLQDCISKSPVLKTLTLGCYNMSEGIKITNRSLRILRLLRCNKLVEIKVDTPNLSFFKYRGANIASFSPMSSLHLLEAMIELYPDNCDALWFFKLSEILNKFNPSELLTLRTNSDDNIIIPEELRASLLPPLYGLKHLRVEIRSSTVNYLALVDGMLWVSPRLESLLISWPYPYKKKCLKFQYGEFMGIPNYSCCKSHPVKCWRHFVKEIMIENYEDREGMHLRNYFHRNLHRLGRSVDFV